MVRKIVSFLGFFLVFFMLVSLSFASVEVFTKYDTLIEINKDYTIDVHKDISLRNIYDVGIVPGEIEFKIINAFEGNGGEILDFEVKDRYGNPIKSKIQNIGDKTIILLNIFTPVLPGFEYNINLDYTIQYESSGIFFKSLQLPLNEVSKIPIQSGTVKVVLPNSYYLTYLGYEDEGTVVNENEISWQLNKDTPEFVDIEYSYIPAGFSGLKGSVVFWLMVNFVLIMILFYQIIKEAKKLKSSIKG